MTDRIVYVVDDEASIRESIETMFSTADIATIAFASAEAFLESGAASRPICVVLDVNLVGMSGLDLLRKLREEKSPAAVIILTGHADVPTAVAAMKLGAFHFIEKPLDGEVLLTAVEEALASAEEEADTTGARLAFRKRMETLSQRETEIFNLLLDGLPTKSIASQLELSTRTVEHHRAAVMRKLEAKSISHLMKLAILR